ncbi:MAG: DUF1565 domain-containing protein, partial [Oscillatoriales cyanobacterium RM1_1_9]|nr:DUF1565 domain-containing protein [Oscillatoriales cyanobacterium RM1_1_9]
MATLYVHPALGTDQGNGSQSAPFKTITKALTKASAGTTIQLEMGTYDAASGETFPLKVPSGVSLVGNETSQGRGILIEGNGQFSSASVATQNVTIILSGTTQLRGITITNSQIRGTGVWVESASPTVANCTFIYCKREGAYATGSGNPTWLNNRFIRNEGYGLSLEGSVAGEVKGNTFQETGYGLSIKDNVTSRITDNAISENRAGILIAGNARPVLRRNLIERNSTDGIVITGNAVPDLGSTQNPGQNIIRNNGQLDINNAGTAAIAAYGNRVSSDQVQGSVNVVAQNTINVLNSTTMTIYVNSASGSDSGSGTQGSPFKTITRALNQVQSGTTIQLAS